MANNYIHFSTVLAHLTTEERAWIEKYLDLCRRRAEWDGDFEYEDENILFVHRFIDEEPYGKGLLMHSDGGGSAESVAVFIQSFLARWRPENGHTFTWAITCDAPRPDEFGGGTMHITKDEINGCDGSCVIPKKEDNAS